MGTIKMEEILRKINEYQHQKRDGKPVTVVIEGIIGSGKSYLAGRIIEYFPEGSILLTMDLFFSVIRSEWKRKFENNRGVLLDWYNQKKRVVF